MSDKILEKIRMTLIKDLMMKSVYSVNPDDSFTDVVDKMIEKGYSGIPVIDKNRKVIGLVTEYDLLTKGTINVFTGSPAGGFYPALNVDDLLDFKVKNLMNSDPIVVREDSTLQDILNIFSEHHRVNPIPVLDKSGILAGIITRYDVIKFCARLLKGR